MTEPTDDQQALREEIARTRADLGETVETLAARTDVKTRAKESVASATDSVKATVGRVADQAGDAIDTARDRVTARAAALREAAADIEVRDAVRRPVPIALIAGIVVAVVAVIVWRRRR